MAKFSSLVQFPVDYFFYPVIPASLLRSLIVKLIFFFLYGDDRLCFHSASLVCFN